MGCGKSKHAVDTQNTITKSSSKRNNPPNVEEEAKGISPQALPENKPVVAADEKKEEETKIDETIVVSETSNNTSADQAINSDQQKSEEELVTTSTTTDIGHQSNSDTSPTALPQIHEEKVDPKKDEAIEPPVVSEIINNTSADQAIISDKQKSEEEVVVADVMTVSKTSDTEHRSNSDITVASLPQVHEEAVDSHDLKNDEAIDKPLVSEIINNEATNEGKTEDDVVIGKVETSTSNDTAQSNSKEEDASAVRLPQSPDEESGATITKD